MERTYLAVDLKSFYASVECVERGLDPLKTNLVVADASRTEKTICLAVSPSLKQYGLGGRARLFEVVQKMRDVNRERLEKTPDKSFEGKSFDAEELYNHSELEADYIAAVPRMALYIHYSTEIYKIYLKYVSEEDIHVYSIDEVFIDITGYILANGLSAQEFAMIIIKDILKQTGITATAGIGTNLYLSKVAMDIVAKRRLPDENGVRIAKLDEHSYRKELWNHRPLTDFWRIGRGYSKKLEEMGLYTMGDIAEFSLKYEDYLYKVFGVNAELLIDHAWGYEPTEIADIKSYKAKSSSISSGQVLQEPYEYEKALLIVKEMADALAYELSEKRLVTDKLTLTIGYDVENISNPKISYQGETVADMYGRIIPKHFHGTIGISTKTASSMEITKAACRLFKQVENKNLLIRRITMSAENTVCESSKNDQVMQLDLFSGIDIQLKLEQKKEHEKQLQTAVTGIKNRFGKNSIIKGISLEKGATATSRNRQIGGHRA